MAAIAGPLSFAALGQCCERRGVPSSVKSLGLELPIRVLGRLSGACVRLQIAVLQRGQGLYAVDCAHVDSYYASSSSWKYMPISTFTSCRLINREVPPTVAETKSNFLTAYKRPILSIYKTVLQELLVQQHLTCCQKSYQYDLALGFVTVDDRLMEGYPSDEDRESIFKAYIQALNEDPEQYRVDVLKLEEWVGSQNADSLIEFSAKGGEVEEMLKGIAEIAGGKGSFSYSRFFAVGLFRLLELANATEPTVLYKICMALNINKRSVNRDLNVYWNLLTKLIQAKELLKKYVDRYNPIGTRNALFRPDILSLHGEEEGREGLRVSKGQRGHHRMLRRVSNCDAVMQQGRDLNHQPIKTTLVGALS